MLAEERGQRGGSNLGPGQQRGDGASLENSHQLEPLLLTHPDDDWSSDAELWNSPCPRRGSMYVDTQFRMAVWLALLLSGYLIQRATCSIGYPHDCLRNINYYEIFSDMTSLSLYGIALGWFVGFTESPRWFWLTDR